MSGSWRRKVSVSTVCAACSDQARELVSHPRILPIKVYPVQIVIVDEFDNVVCECLTVRRPDCAAKNPRSSRRGAESPSTKGDDLLDIFERLEPIELVLELANVHLEVGRDVGKGEVDVGILRRVDRVHMHIQAGSIEIPRTKVSHLDLLLRGFRFDDGSTTV